MYRRAFLPGRAGCPQPAAALWDETPYLRRRARLVALLIIVLAALTAYHNSFGGPFTFDDAGSIQENRTIRHLWPLGPVLSPPSSLGQTVGGRPMLNLSLALNYAVSGTGVWSYHAVNLLIHVLAGLVLFGVVRRTMGLKGERTRAEGERMDVSLHPTFVAFAAALWWTVHPLQTESVTYVVQRAESLMGLFYLLTFYCFIRAIESGRATRLRSPGGELRRGSEAGGKAWAWLAVICCLLGMATKEAMVSAPLLVLLYDRTFVAGSFRAAVRARPVVYLALAATWILLAVLMLGTGNRGGSIGFGIGISWWAYALTQFHAVAHYLWLSCWPRPQIFDYGSYWVSRAGEVLPYAAVVLALLAATAWALVRRPALGFLGSWFFLILAPTSSVVPGTTQMIVEHRMYLPLAAVMVLAAALLDRWRRPGLALGLALAVAAAGVTLTRHRNEVYRSDLALWQDTVAKRPGYARAHNNLGTVFLNAGRTGEAMAEFLKTSALDPDYAEAHNNRGTVLLQSGRLGEAIAQYEEALRLRPAYPKARKNLGVALAAAGRGREAIAQYEEALRLLPDYAEARYALGNARLQLGEPAAAAAEFAAAVRQNPDYAEAHNNLGLALFHQHRDAEAIVEYRAALRLKPGDGQAHNNLGNALADSGRLPEAITEYEEALRLHPDLAEARANLAEARAQAAAGR
jgi:tetratricopeptide (TPR) repeat protein